MNDQAPGPNLAATLKLLWPYLPGVAGAGAVLSMAIAEKLTMKGKVLSLACGVVASIWLAPMAAALLSLVCPEGAVSAHVLCGYFGYYRVIDVAAAVTDANDRVTWDAAKVMADLMHMNEAGQAAVFAQAKIDVPELGASA